MAAPSPERLAFNTTRHGSASTTGTSIVGADKQAIYKDWMTVIFCELLLFRNDLRRAAVDMVADGDIGRAVDKGK